MEKIINNRLTGPTDLPPAVRKAMDFQMVSHRSHTFKVVFKRMGERLQKILNTQASPMVMTCSGTGGLDAAVVNTLSRTDNVLVMSAGYYGELFAEIAAKYLPKGNVHLESMPAGKAVHPDDLKKILLKKKFDAVLLTHSESASGILNPIPELAQVIRQHSDALILVDAVSSVGTTEFRMDDWGIDVAITVSQKALMSPPGLAILVASDRAIALSRRSDRIGSFYFDFTRTLDMMPDQTASTPCIVSIWAVDAALDLIEKEGDLNVFQRHADLALRCQRGVRAAGFQLFAEEGARAPGVTAIWLPDHLDAEGARATLEREANVMTATGVGRWHDRILRIGHMGMVNAAQIDSALAALAFLK